MSQSLHPGAANTFRDWFPGCAVSLREAPFASRQARPRSPACIPQGSEGKPEPPGAQTRTLLAHRSEAPQERFRPGAEGKSRSAEAALSPPRCRGAEPALPAGAGAAACVGTPPPPPRAPIPGSEPRDGEGQGPGGDPLLPASHLGFGRRSPVLPHPGPTRASSPPRTLPRFRNPRYLCSHLPRPVLSPPPSRSRPSFRY